MTQDRRELFRQWMEIIRPLTKEWHRSEEGRKWHSEHGKKCWEKRKIKARNCEMCGNEFKTKTYHQRFCHQNCKMRARTRRLKSLKEEA